MRDTEAQQIKCQHVQTKYIILFLPGLLPVLFVFKDV